LGGFKQLDSFPEFPNNFTQLGYSGFALPSICLSDSALVGGHITQSHS